MGFSVNSRPVLRAGALGSSLGPSALSPQYTNFFPAKIISEEKGRELPHNTQILISVLATQRADCDFYKRWVSLLLTQLLVVSPPYH